MRKFLFIGLLMSLAFGCGEGRQSSELANHSVYKELLLDRRTIPVCWYNSGHDSKAMRQLIEPYIIAETSKAGFRFHSWKTCALGDIPEADAEDFNQSIFANSIKIYLHGFSDSAEIIERYFKDSEHAAADARGMLMNQGSADRSGAPRAHYGLGSLSAAFSMVLPNASFKDTYPRHQYLYQYLQRRYRTPESEKRVQNFIKTLALHEFGHVLGLEHEHAHPDNRTYQRCNTAETHRYYMEAFFSGPELEIQMKAMKEVYDEELKTEKKLRSDLKNLYKLEPIISGYDPDSIMNYCNYYAHDFSTPRGFSEKDIAFIQRIYRGIK